MIAPVPEPGPAERPTGAARGHLARHGRAMAGVLVVSGVGVLSTAAFQLTVIRGLGPSGYGLLASFLALINVASVGSTALRNSVAVVAAHGRTAEPVDRGERRRLDGSTVEALVLGAVCTVGVVVASPLLDGASGTSGMAVAFVALTVAPYFLFARAQGLLQGTGRARAVVFWTTGVQLAQLALSLAALTLGLAAVGVLSVLLLTSVAAAAGSGVQVRRLGLATAGRAFTADTVVVMALTIAFTWLISMDVVLVRSYVDDDVAGAYAAAATVVKTVLIVPTTLSLYLLPRFVARRRDASLTRLGVGVVLGTSLAGAVVMVGAVVVLGDLVASIFGAGYARTGELLPMLALSYVPWAMAQGLLIPVTAASSRTGVGVLVGLAVAQWVLGSLALPSVETFVAVNGGVGAAALVGLLLVQAGRVGREARAGAGSG